MPRDTLSRCRSERGRHASAGRCRSDGQAPTARILSAASFPAAVPSMLIILPSVLQPRKARCGTLQILYQADRIFFNIPIEICRVREYLFYEQTPFARTVHTPHIEIPAYRLCGFMGCFAQLQIYALPSEWYSLRSDPLLRRHSTRKRHLCPPFRYPRRTGHKNKAFRPLNAQNRQHPTEAGCCLLAVRSRLRRPIS